MFNTKWHSENIEIKISKKQYDKINYLINSYHKKYDNELFKIKQIEKNNLIEFNLDNELYLIKKHNLLIKKILVELANEFSLFKKYNVTIFINGSFARFSNKTNSDLDLHFLYDNNFKKFLYKDEESYFYIISSLIGVERNNLHSVITTKLSYKNLDYFDNLNDNKFLSVKLKYNNNYYYQYRFYPVTKKRFFLQYANDKSYNAFNKKLIEEIKNNNSEWAHNFYAVTNNDYFSYNYNNYLFKYEKQLLNKSYLINLINFYKSSLKTNIFNSNNIAEIKKRYQQQAFNHIYNIINVYRMFLNYKGKHIKYYNVNNFLFKKDFENIPNCDIIIENIYKYLWIVKKLSIYCEDNNIPYSIHKYNIVDIDFLNDISNQEIILNKCLLSILNYMERNL